MGFIVLTLPTLRLNQSVDIDTNQRLFVYWLAGSKHFPSIRNARIDHLILARLRSSERLVRVRVLALEEPAQLQVALSKRIIRALLEVALPRSVRYAESAAACRVGKR